MTARNRANGFGWYVMRRFGLLAVATAAVLTGCSHVYEKRYSLSDESAPITTFEGYRIETRLQSRVAGYKGSEDVFYLNFVTTRTDAPMAFSIPDSLMRLEFDSVCVRLFRRDSVLCLEKLGQRIVIDNFYQATEKRSEYLFSGLQLTKGNVYVWVSYVVRLINDHTGEVLTRRRVEQELKRFKYAEY